MFFPAYLVKIKIIFAFNHSVPVYKIITTRKCVQYVYNNRLYVFRFPQNNSENNMSEISGKLSKRV
jgi:hypothetical protein